MALLDHNGEPLGIGDKVQMTGVLTEVDQNTVFINCLVTLDEAPPTGPATTLHLNTRQVELTSIGTPVFPGLDEFGRPASEGDEVKISGTIVGVKEGAPMDILMELDALMPPSGTRLRIPLNATQVEVTETSLTQRRLLRLNQQVGDFEQQFRELYE